MKHNWFTKRTLRSTSACELSAVQSRIMSLRDCVRSAFFLAVFLAVSVAFQAIAVDLNNANFELPAYTGAGWPKLATGSGTDRIDDSTVNVIDEGTLTALETDPVTKTLLEPGEKMDYSKLAFFPDRWKSQNAPMAMYPWEGDEIVFLTTTNDFDRAIMARFVNTLDAGWKLYGDLVGGQPEVLCQWHQKVPIAAVPNSSLTCGYGCGYVGATGIEASAFYNKDYPLAVSDPEAFSHYYFYEMGRNFYIFGDRHSLFTTGYAVFMRYVCMETLGLADRDVRTYEIIKNCEAVYADSDISFLTAFTNLSVGEKGNRLKDKEGKVISPSDQPVMYATVMLKLRKCCGGNAWLKRLFHHLDQCPAVKVKNEADALRQSLNWLVSASAAAQRDLTPIFVKRWRMPLNQASCKVMSEVNWKSDQLVMSEIIDSVRNAENSN